MISETSQRKTNIACYHLNMCYFKKTSQSDRNREWKSDCQRKWGKQGEAGKRI